MKNSSPLFPTLSILLLPIVILLSLAWDYKDAQSVKSTLEHNNTYEFIRE